MEDLWPAVPQEIFVNAVKKCISANRDFIPPEGKGSLYLRPLLIGKGRSGWWVGDSTRAYATCSRNMRSSIDLRVTWGPGVV